MPVRKPITNFSRGEFGAQLYGRVDIPQYEAGAKQLVNFNVQRYGGVRFRDGFRYVAPVFGPIGDPVRLIPNVPNIDTGYVLVMRDEVMNVAALGGMVLEEDLKIVDVTYGVTTTLHVPFHSFVVGEMLYLSGNTGPGGLNGRFVEVTAIPDADHVTVDLDSSGYAALTASSGIVRVGAPPAPPAPEPPPAAPPPDPAPPATGGGGGTGGSGGAGGGGGFGGFGDGGNDEY